MRCVLTILGILISFSGLAQEKELVQWNTIQQADTLQLQGDKRPIFADVYAEWCGPCKLMDKNTFQNEEVAKFINENFIPVKFDAEAEQELVFKGREYKWVSAGRTGVQSLAYVLLGGQLRYPSMPIVDHSGQVLTIISGYFPPDDFLKILNELKVKIDDYMKTAGNSATTN